MANERLNIPSKLKVGFQERPDTYSGKLAYVTYVDKKGKTAKHTSWEHWRSKNMDTLECDNKPTEGFVLNKRVGGYKSGWNFRQTKCRVYDPRGFEVEISLENLLFILQECTSTKGKGLEGEFVYAWQGPELILLPICSEDYKLSTDLRDRQEKIMVKDLKLGAAYKSNDSSYIIYIGKMEWYIWDRKEDEIGSNQRYRYDSSNSRVYDKIRLVKMSTFVDVENRKFIGYKTTNKIDYLIEENAISLDDVATYVENYKTTPAYMSKNLVSITLDGGLDDWNKYIQSKSDSGYYWGVDLYYKTPGDTEIMHIKGEKHSLYQGMHLSEWLNKHGCTSYYKSEEKDRLTEEFNKNCTMSIKYRHVSTISFKNGQLRRIYTDNTYRNMYELKNITEKDWCYMIDGDSYGFYKGLVFLDGEGREVKYWANSSLSNGTIKFNEDAPLPENI